MPTEFAAVPQTHQEMAVKDSCTGPVRFKSELRENEGLHFTQLQRDMGRLVPIWLTITLIAQRKQQQY